MKKTIYAFLVVASATSAMASETTTLTITKPIKIAKTSLNFYEKQGIVLTHANEALRKVDSNVHLGYEEESYAAGGKIFSLEQLIGMPAGAIDGLLGENHCVIYDNRAFTIKQGWSWKKFSMVPTSVVLKGKFRAETWYDVGTNEFFYASIGHGDDHVEQRIGRDYYMFDDAGEKTMVSCHTRYKSKSMEEAKAKYDAYAASGSFGPLKAALGI